MIADVRIELCTSVEQPGWLAFRQALWPMETASGHLSAMEAQIAAPQRFAQFVAYTDAGQPVGFAEVSIRSDYVNGTHSSPVGFLEGIYVVPEARQQGIARALLVEVDR